MIHCLLATGQGALWIVAVPLLAVVIVAAVLSIGWLLWIWRGGRGARPSTASEVPEGEDMAMRRNEFMSGYGTLAAPVWTRYVPFLLLVAIALLIGVWLHSLGFMQGVWSR